jgi:probable rRNA maturation factor
MSRVATGRARGRGGALEVVLISRQRLLRVNAVRLRQVLQTAASELRVSGAVSLVLTGDRTLRRLNRTYRGKDYATDVLSFPGPGGEGGLGDILVSVETAERNARERGHSLARELDVLALHGFLHVLGHDHERDGGQMDRLEGRLRRRLLARSGRAASGRG